MVELLRYLEANGFTSYIASGGSRDFMRPIADEMYGIPPERVIGSSNALRYDEDEHGGSVATTRSPTCSTTGRPSRCASGAASAGGRSSPSATRTATSRCCVAPASVAPSLSLLVLHDDAEREFVDERSAETALKQAGELGLGGRQHARRLGDGVRGRLMGEAIGQILPFAVGVGLSPVPIIAVVVMLSTPRARANGPAFMLGWLAGLAVVGTVVFLISGAVGATERARAGDLGRAC